MEICALNKTVPSFIELPLRVKQLRETAETVIPDTNNDVLKIAACSLSTELKGKETFGNRLTVSFDVSADIICISENNNLPEKVTIRKSVSTEFESEKAFSEKLSHIELKITNYEAKLINPRKTAVMFEVTVSLHEYSEYNFPVEIALPETQEFLLHKKLSEHEAMLISEVSEKPFVITGQMNIENLEPDEILSCKEFINIEDTEYIGTKTVIKGRADFDFLCRNNDTADRVSLSLPFSQVLDSGCDGAVLLETLPQINSRYYTISDSISGGKVLEAEIHAVMQYRVYTKAKALYPEDIYCNTKRISAETQNINICSDLENSKYTVSVTDKLSLPEDYGSTLCIYPNLTRCEYENNILKTEIAMDIIYLSREQELMSIHRVMLTETKAEITGKLMTENIISADIQNEQLECSLELISATAEKKSADYIQSVSYDEDESFEFDALPGFTIVRTENETLWELAKSYTSTIEAIKEYNDFEITQGQMILIPKTK